MSELCYINAQPSLDPDRVCEREAYSGKVKGGRTVCTDRGARGESEAQEREWTGGEQHNITE